jgi:hypothetical protein
MLNVVTSFKKKIHFTLKYFNFFFYFLFFFFFFFFFFNFTSKVKKFAIYSIQILKFFNVADLLLKSVFFDKNRPTCVARGVLRANLLKNSLKNIYIYFLN